ncbi:MAG TPA: OsmC family protein [Chryseolinea sp.]|nr:OsmC family protein [Chryseolinea sp.]
MLVRSTIKNTRLQNRITVVTDGDGKELDIPVKANGRGSSVNGAELLFLSLATCFCNDIYREATKRKLHVDGVEVTVSGEFGNEGEPAQSIVYEVKVDAASCTPDQINDLIVHVDGIAEIHNTLRKGIQVSLRI